MFSHVVLFPLSLVTKVGKVAQLTWVNCMKLGYMMVPRIGCSADKKEVERRTESASKLGISEFYCAAQEGYSDDSFAPDFSLEHADSLRILTNFPARQQPRLVAVNGKHHRREDRISTWNMAIPCKSPEQVRANVQVRQASLSVSWLNKTELAQHWNAHVTSSTHAGLRVRPEDWRIARTIVVSQDAAYAEAAVKDQHSPCRVYYDKIARSQGTDVETLLEACVIYGTLNNVLDALVDLKESCGPFGTLCLVDHAWPDPQMALYSMTSLVSAFAPTLHRSRA